MASKKFDKYTTSFSGADMIVMFLFPNAAPVTIGTASTVGYSLFRQIAQVRTMGRISSKGYARGGVTFAGSIVFTVVNQSFLEDIKAAIPYLADYTNIRPDELPPFDVLITFANELGQSATLMIYGASFTDETTTFSVEDIFTENVLTFMARDIRHMKSGEQVINRSVSFNAATELLGKFYVADLYATQEAKDREAKLAEIEAAQKSRAELAIEKPAWEPSPASEPSNDKTGASATHGNLQVSVRSDVGRQPIAGATVVMTDPNNGYKATRVTDSTGNANFNHIKAGKAVPFEITHKDYNTLKGTSEVIKAGALVAKAAYMTKKADTNGVPDNIPTKMVFFSPYDKAMGHIELVPPDRVVAGYYHSTDNNKPAIQLSNDNNGFNIVPNHEVQWSYKIRLDTVSDEDMPRIKDWMKFYKIAESGSFPAIRTNSHGNASLNDNELFRFCVRGVVIQYTCKVTGKPSINKSIYLTMHRS